MPPGQTAHIQSGVSALAPLKAAPTLGFNGTRRGASVDSSEGPGGGVGGQLVEGSGLQVLPAAFRPLQPGCPPVATVPRWVEADTL